MSYDEIEYAVRDRIATIALNRPDRLNAWTTVMEGEIRAAMVAAAGDDAVRVIVLTGTGRGFCAGADMSLLQSTDAVDPEERRAKALLPPGDAQIPGRLDVPEDYSLRYTYFPSVPKPIIAAINGPCAGLGLIMSLYCDFRFASEAAVLTTAFARRGLIAEHGIDWILPRIVGFPNALDLLMTARRVSPEEALAKGLVNAVYPPETFANNVRDFALDLAQAVSPRSMRVMKTQLYTTAGLGRSLADAVRHGNEEMFASFGTEDFKEGVAHFVEQRAANFKGC
jgi:enoyl-CoA hydratase/carnithine racemase